MEILEHLIIGFGTAATAANLLWCLAGVVLGTLVGILPGLGPTAAISLLLPLTLSFGDATTALIFLAGLYYGTQYGGSTTSILLNLPGEPSAVITALDGHAMTKNGRGGAALAIAAISSFVAGTIATIVVMLVSKPLAEFALIFGPTEYASLMLLGMLTSATLIQGPFWQGIGMVCLGILLGLIGTDINTGVERFTFGNAELVDGLEFSILAMAVFGLADIIHNIFHSAAPTTPTKIPLRELYPNQQEFKQSISPSLRGTGVGSLLGLLPGGGAIIASFVSYVMEKKISKDPDKFGKGNPAGVAGPEAANNAGAQTSFIPMLSLGLPITPSLALILGVLIMHGVAPGPEVVSGNSTLFWAFIASMWISNCFLLLLNYPLISIWISLLRINWKFLYPLIFLISIAGAYWINNSWFDVAMLLVLIMIGYLFKKLSCEPAPLVMGFIIGPMFEEHLRRSLTISGGDWLTFFERPISTGLLILTVAILILSVKIKNHSPQWCD